MTSAEEVPRIPCSVGARQAEPPAPQMGSCTSYHEAEICSNQPEMSTDRAGQARSTDTGPAPAAQGPSGTVTATYGLVLPREKSCKSPFGGLVVRPVGR